MLWKCKRMQSILYVDSTMRASGTEGDFSIELRETLQLNDHGVRVDKLRVTNSFLTTDLGRHIYFRDPGRGWYSII